MSRRSQLVDWLFRHRQNGRIALGQAPNLEQQVFQLTTVIGTFLPKSRLRTALGVVAIGALSVWGFDELLRGVNPFRRLLGLVALGGIVLLARRR
jgi:hypothetical protein